MHGIRNDPLVLLLLLPWATALTAPLVSSRHGVVASEHTLAALKEWPPLLAGIDETSYETSRQRCSACEED
jgi:hypothetical protein